MKSNSVLISIGFYILWILTAGLWAVAIFRMHDLTVLLGAIVIRSPLRPEGWNASTLTGVYRCGFLILGSLWLGITVFAEKYLREAASAHHLLKNAGLLLLIGGGLYLFSTGLLFLLS